ncbi:TonB-dependent receptor [Halopseudomonas pachastrellae]|nr:TonB-dependent receptor [Halopseudomonas pachastrellae]
MATRHRTVRPAGNAGRWPELGLSGEGLQRDEFNRVESREAYLISTWQLAPRWSLTAGARYSKVKFDSDDSYFADGQDDSGSVRYDQTSPALGLSYQWTPEINCMAR